MKLLRMGTKGHERPCVLDADGRIRDVSAYVDDFVADGLTEELLLRLSALTLANLPEIKPESTRIGSPFAGPRNIFCVGLNYSDHAHEAGLPIPIEPILFNKPSGSFCGPNDPIYWTSDMTKLDWEVELGIVIGNPAFRVTRDKALEHVFGYTIVNDVSERSWQMERGGQWMKGKSFPNFCPTGPWLVTRDEVPNAQALTLWLDVNGECMQRGNTEKMIFPADEIVAYMSKFMRLERGDLICTGTPPGVGAGKKPARFLHPGDVVALGIADLGQQRHETLDLGAIEP